MHGEHAENPEMPILSESISIFTNSRFILMANIYAPMGLLHMATKEISLFLYLSLIAYSHLLPGLKYKHLYHGSSC